jgi:hypothetical protein
LLTILFAREEHLKVEVARGEHQRLIAAYRTSAGAHTQSRTAKAATAPAIT